MDRETLKQLILMIEPAEHLKSDLLEAMYEQDFIEIFKDKAQFIFKRTQEGEEYLYDAEVCSPGQCAPKKLPEVEAYIAAIMMLFIAIASYFGLYSNQKY